MHIITDCDSTIGQVDGQMGTNPALHVRSFLDGSTSKNRRTCIKFPISSIPGTINNVMLCIFRYLGSGSRTYEIRRVTGAWTETGILWSNQPTTTDMNKVEFTTVDGWNEIDITNMFNDETGSTFSVQIKDKVEDDWIYEYLFHSREHNIFSPVNKPNLEINTYYVKIGGNDALDGKSWANAWATINKAATTVADGSTVRIGFGDYHSEPTPNKIAPQNIGTLGIDYYPMTAETGGGTGTVSVEQNA